MDKNTRDIFICHASEDKAEIVATIVEAFEQAGISFWYDEAEIKWGDGIIAKVNEGLKKSKYVMVVLSTNFMNKNWPQKELSAAFNQEITSGDVRVLPLIVGTEKEIAKIIAELPLLNDKRYLPWDGNVRKIVDAIMNRLKGATKEQGAEQYQNNIIGINIPLPKIKKQFTQRDRDMFLQDALIYIKKYFEKALKDLETQYQEVKTDYKDIHMLKFISTIYIQGEIANRCKIWLGSMFSSESILYQAGQFNIDSDNSFNESLSVCDDGQTLGLKPTGMWYGGRSYKEKGQLTKEESAEYLWKQFTEQLG